MTLSERADDGLSEKKHSGSSKVSMLEKLPFSG